MSPRASPQRVVTSRAMGGTSCAAGGIRTGPHRRRRQDSVALPHSPPPRCPSQGGTESLPSLRPAPPYLSFGMPPLHSRPQVRPLNQDHPGSTETGKGPLNHSSIHHGCPTLDCSGAPRGPPSPLRGWSGWSGLNLSPHRLHRLHLPLDPVASPVPLAPPHRKEGRKALPPSQSRWMRWARL